jgi:hypothetical protein
MLKTCGIDKISDFFDGEILADHAGMWGTSIFRHKKPNRKMEET